MKAPDSMLDKLILKDYRRPGTENQDKKDAGSYRNKDYSVLCG